MEYAFLMEPRPAHFSSSGTVYRFTFTISHTPLPHKIFQPLSLLFTSTTMSTDFVAGTSANRVSDAHAGTDRTGIGQPADKGNSNSRGIAVGIQPLLCIVFLLPHFEQAVCTLVPIRHNIMISLYCFSFTIARMQNRGEKHPAPLCTKKVLVHPQRIKKHLQNSFLSRRCLIFAIALRFSRPLHFIQAAPFSE